ncbi:MAG: ABC transporter substrate-binding protein [Actinomycetota bacterium]
MGRRGFAAAVAALVMGLLFVSASSGSPTRSASLPIGAMFSLTGSGDVFGPQQVKGARLAVDQINAQGGVDGVPLRLVVRDDRSDPATGKAAMKQLIRTDKAVAVLGPTLSAVAFSADPIADSLQTPVIGISNTAAGIVGKCAYDCRWIWRDSLGESIAVPANISAYVFEAHPTTAAILHVAGDVLGDQEAQVARISFRSNSVRLTADVSVPSGTDNVTAAVRKAIAAKPAVLFIGTVSGASAAQLMKVARAQGFGGTFLGGNTFNSDATAALAGSAGDGARSASAWYRGNAFPANSAFVSAYKQRYGQAPDQFAAQAYIGVQIVADALERGHVATSDKPLATTRATLQKQLPNVALLTPIGPFRFTADHDVSQIVWVLAMTGKGSHRLAGFCNPGC